MGGTTNSTGVMLVLKGSKETYLRRTDEMSVGGKVKRSVDSLEVATEKRDVVTGAVILLQMGSVLNSILLYFFLPIIHVITELIGATIGKPGKTHPSVLFIFP